MYNILHQLQLEADQERAIHVDLQMKKYLCGNPSNIWIALY